MKNWYRRNILVLVRQIAALAGFVSICTSSPVSAIEDNRIIVNTPNQVISGNHSGVTNNNNWHDWWCYW